MTGTSRVATKSAAVISFLLLLGANAAHASEIRVLCALALRPAMSELVPAFEISSGHKVTIDYGRAPAFAARLKKGEAADLVIVVRRSITDLQNQGKIAGDSAVDIAKVGVGMFVRKGAPKPDISSVEAFKRTLLAAKSIGHADPGPAGGGAIAIYVAGLLGGLDIAADIRPKIRLFPPSVYDSIANGEVEIGFGSISEVMADSRIELVGPLPTAIQNYTQFTAGIVANSKQAGAQERVRPTCANWHRGQPLNSVVSCPGKLARSLRLVYIYTSKDGSYEHPTTLQQRRVCPPRGCDL